jgi:predicted GIY-YIG superfamily endonuclease
MDLSFNILNCFDDNIENLDITKYYIYVLQLIDDRYYVGRTGNILTRIEQHFTGCGSLYTMMYKPIKVIEVTEEFKKEDERNKTLEIMSKYGWEKVRGAGWCSLEIKKPKEKIYKKKKNEHERSIIINEHDKELLELYNYEEKDIEYISNILHKSPGWVAKRLEILNIVERKQLARGYMNYIESDEYKLRYKLLYKSTSEKSCTKIENNIKSNLTKEELSKIKILIREKYLNDKSC